MGNTGVCERTTFPIIEAFVLDHVVHVRDVGVVRVTHPAALAQASILEGWIVDEYLGPKGPLRTT